jgi:hypothetical protein
MPGNECRNKSGVPDPDACSKYCTAHPFDAACEVCGEPLRATYALLEVLGAYHSGCFGFPACLCRTKHHGECPDPTLHKRSDT